MDSHGVARAVAAARSVASSLDLEVDDVAIVQNSNRLALRLLPCDVFARVAPMGQEVAALEVELAQRLVAVKAPVAALASGVDPFVYQCDGFVVTWWTHYETGPLNRLSPIVYARSLERLHAGMRKINVVTPHFTDRIEEARQLVRSRNRTPALDSPGRELLIETFTSVSENIDRIGVAEQILHGEPHPGNILDTKGGPLFIDLETCCRGPVEFDLAHVPEGVCAHYLGVDQDLLGQCRRLVLAMVAAWRWDAHDQFPDGLRHGRALLTLLRQGPPWPALGDLGSE